LNAGVNRAGANVRNVILDAGVPGQRSGDVVVHPLWIARVKLKALAA
jgi:hypothetical protein